MRFTSVKKKWLPNCKLYLILDAQVTGYGKLCEIAKQAVEGGVDIIQLRDKSGTAADIIRASEKIIRFTKNKVPYIINDRVDIARIVDCDGVHVGQEDIPVGKAREILGAKKVIGVSCQSMRHCLKAQKDGADYIGFGSVFKTKTKPERVPMRLDTLKMVLKRIAVPVFPIGGINIENIALLQSMAVRRVAVCRAICEASDPVTAAAQFKRSLSILKQLNLRG